MAKRMSYRWKVLQNLYPHAYGVKRYWVILFVLSVFSMSLEFVTPMVYRLFINDVILGAELQKLRMVIVGYLVLFFAGVIIGYVKNFAKYSIVNTVLYRVRKKILDHFLAIPFAEYEMVSVGDLKMRIDDDTEQIKVFAGNQTIDYLIAYITAAVSIFVLLRINPVIAVFSIVAIPFTVWLDHIIGEREKNFSEKRRTVKQEMASWMHASVQCWREVKSLNLSRHETRRYYQFLHEDMLEFATWINYWTARCLIIPKIKNDFFMQFGLYLIGGLLIIAGKLKIGDLLVFSLYYSMLSDAIKTISASDADLESNMPYTDRLMESLKSPDNSDQTGIMPDASHMIVLEDVSFAYPGGEQKIMHNFNLVIERGERVAITGKSGSGKTTLLKLITGMLMPTYGRVTFASVDLREIHLEAMHSRMGFVMQENILFHTTIRENLLYGKRNATEDELLAACKSACIYDFVTALPEGLDTVIGEKGIKLSGGQRQRIVLARMFLQDVDIFIFDEATSALDQYSESIIQDAITNISREKTIIVVAHRESSISVCDRVVKM